jgi:hypothetical protein
MMLLALAPGVVAAVLSYGSTTRFVLALVNAVASFFAINTIGNLGTQRETGQMIDAWETYKSVGVAVLTITWMAAAVLIVLAVA